MHKFTIFIVLSCLVIVFLVDATRPSVCELPPVHGMCRAYFKRFFFNSTINRCESFIYGGCQGNGNRFQSSDECMRVCE
ncbi:unnamed protein product [Rotaria sordida]|uniref:BPTI/Kunitz inhibitor domain-containing protein n=1 Tax=Rotaria sordida TaxID=392033 RepID=A0A815Y221_9BILA|nr:unnamed protein product [Rotaria sordida]